MHYILAKYQKKWGNFQHLIETQTNLCPLITVHKFLHKSRGGNI